ncbi:hypothetical protein E2C01_065834 [Portunus trituberculatus]|uniref:Uncharacterized protein n=1 Tax=Portunus trituberculatus TaxID=210409 RepID=A0A5B7HNN0_PORTR|nr:hypothetical protein [Portunus trituberculatus]
MTFPLSNAFHFSTVLFGKLYFPISFTHCLILIFFSCPLVLPSASVNSTRSSLSIFSISFTIIYIVIRSLQSLLSYKIRSPISFSRSPYVRSFNSCAIFVAIFCILSNFLVSFLELGDHTTAAYSSLGCIMLMIFFHHIFIHVMKCHSYISQYLVCLSGPKYLGCVFIRTQISWLCVYQDPNILVVCLSGPKYLVHQGSDFLVSSLKRSFAL